MDKSSRVYVAGHRGLVGGAICRKLLKDGYENLILRDRADLDLTDSAQVNAFFGTERPEYVFLAAARVGGILANSTYPVEFIRQVHDFKASSRSDRVARLHPDLGRRRTPNP